MSLSQGAKGALESIFRQRMEEVVANETVTELGKKKASLKPKLLVLCRPLGNSSSYTPTNSLHIVQSDDHQRMKVKQSFSLERLTECTHEGDFDATFNFGAGGMLTVTFESHIQREMFVAAVQRLQNAHTGGARTRSAGIRGVLTQNVEALADADAATRVRKLRQERRRIFSSREEQHLLKHMGHTTFDDVKRFQEVLLFQQKEAELASVDTLIRSADAWRAAREQVQSLSQEVEELEGRIEGYSSHLLSKKDVIQQIEHDNNTLQRKQHNLENLYIMMADLRDQLSLPAGTLALVARLRTEPNETLTKFFAEGQNARLLSEGMKHMQSVLHNPKLEADFPIAAVAERKAFFLETRRMIAHRSRSYIVSTIEEHEAAYLADRLRYSSDSALIWRLHLELTAKLLSVADIIVSLSRIDVEEFTGTLRKYRTSSQKVYALEMHKFFKCLRKQVKKVSSWRGPFLLGSAVDRSGAMEARMETAQAGETPRMWRGDGGSVSPALTPRMLVFDDDRERDGDASSRQGSSQHHHQLTVVFPSSPYVSNVDLYSDPDVLRRLDARAASTSVVGSIRSLGSGGGGAAGYLRPDLAFAIALQSAMTAILHEEHVLSTAFDVREAPPPQDDAVDESIERNASFIPTDAGRGTAAATATTEPANPLFNPLLLQESVLELFGGDKMSFAEADQQRQELQGPAKPPLYPSSSAYGGATDDAKPADPDETALTTLLKNNYLLREMVSLATFFGEKCDRIYTPAMLCMVRDYRSSALRLPTQRSSFCQAILAEMESVLASSLMRFVAEQTESINRCRRKYIVKPTALLHCFTQMPAFFMRMESTHRLFSVAACDVTEYNSIASSVVDQSFDALDYVTNIKATNGEGKEIKLTLGEVIQKKVNSTMDSLLNMESAGVKRGFIQQYRHHAFFCAFYNMLPTDSFASEQLADHFETSKSKKERYEELYLSRVLFVRDFPLFGPFVASAEDLSHIYTRDELHHHRALAVDAVKKVVDKLAKDIKGGARTSAERMKKHMLRDVEPGSADESFHRALLQRTWQHYTQLVLQKFDFFIDLLGAPMYAGLAPDITRSEVATLLASF